MCPTFFYKPPPRGGKRGRKKKGLIPSEQEVQTRKLNPENVTKEWSESDKKLFVLGL